MDIANRKKKLCFVIPTHWKAHMGGSQYQAKCIIDALLPTHKYDIYYLSRRVDPNYQPDHYQIRKIGGRSAMSRLGFFIDAPQLLNTLKVIKPDIIYQRVACAYTGITSYYARSTAAKMIWHIAHDSDVSLDNNIQIKNYLSKYIENVITTYGINHANYIVAQTNNQAKLLLKNYNREADAVIPNFHPHPSEAIEKTDRTIKILWVANFKPWKQPHIFVRLAKDLSKYENVELIMVGSLPSGSPDWSNTLLEKIKQTDNLVFLGKKSQAEVNSILAEAHIFVNTSLHEGFANTFIQAWMRKVPVVSLCVNPDEVFTKQKVGFFSNSYQKLLEDVILLIENKELREQYGERAQTYAYENHSYKNVNRLIEIMDR